MSGVFYHWLKAGGSVRTSVRVWMFLFREVLGWSVHQLPLLCAAVASVKHTASVLPPSPRPQIRHGVPDRADTKRVSQLRTVERQRSCGLQAFPPQKMNSVMLNYEPESFSHELMVNTLLGLSSAQCR